MSGDTTQVVYMVAHENGDDMCGGLNLHGIYTSEDAAEARLNEVVQEGFWGVTVYAVPLNIPGWLGYGSNRYDVIHDALMAGNTCEPGCVRSSLHQGDCEFEPDPLDENNHQDRIDRNGDRWTHRKQGTMQWCVESCNCFGVWDVSDIDRNFGPLRFADEEEL